MAKPKKPRYRSDRVIFVTLAPAAKEALRVAATNDRRTISQMAAIYIEAGLGRKAA